jgi:hypothetical protein
VRRRIWGLPVVLQWGCAEPETAVPAAATVVHVVHHYAPAGVGGIGPDPRVVQAILQPQAAITEGTEE